MTDVMHPGSDDEPDSPPPDVVTESPADAEPPEGFEPA